MDYSGIEHDSIMIPPPIVAYDVGSDGDTIIKGLKRFLKYECSLKHAKDTVYFYTYSKDDYEMLIKYLQFHEHGYYTYQNPWHRTQFIVLKNYNGNEEEITADLKEKGINCLGVHIINRNVKRAVIPARLLTFDKYTNLDKVKSITHLGKYCGFHWTYYTSNKYTPIQCSRCQIFDHDARFCHMPPNCNVCAEQHFSKDCNVTDTRICFNCKGKHSAYDSMCPEWISYKDRLASTRMKAEKESWKSKCPVNLGYVDKECRPLEKLYGDLNLFWKLTETFGVTSICYDYETSTILFDYGQIPSNGELISIVTSSPSRPFKRGIRRTKIILN